ncbi:hypothetical protein V6N11_019016 [Hibiscus sabdariffa]|uniref:RNase H type-1 domain-containing protein n=1 Tax=Hibiscus sabdariffa TaxID=183260 RepID=A0ABR2R1W0_9ROSI
MDRADNTNLQIEVGDISMFMAELYEVFSHAWRSGFRKIELESDNSTVVEILTYPWSKVMLLDNPSQLPPSVQETPHE